MGDGFKKILDSTDLDEKLKAKTGIDLNSIDEKKIAEVKKLIGNNIDKVDVASIAKKVGIPEDAVKKVVASLKK